MKNDYDLVAIGEIAVDAFIRLKDAHVHCKIDTDACELCVRFGDKIPYESVTEIPAVANAGNASVCASRLNLSRQKRRSLPGSPEKRRSIHGIHND